MINTSYGIIKTAKESLKNDFSNFQKKGQNKCVNRKKILKKYKMAPQICKMHINMFYYD